ncbi:vesicular-fusion ATPase-like protein [Trypanosoma grayi]|uniref:vesicular-fusion ATPase-like protein n=1 Tax=Trypanosoma grayi TaxID=71804 RepID=UPI0004F46F1F|nr:vesicular-fusion ATPase-like protein [Trypanosoma grayi]KEG11599.1 vesicular-fusion ATPase-like protein [Trypanosoma grayi]
MSGCSAESVTKPSPLSSSQQQKQQPKRSSDQMERVVEMLSISGCERPPRPGRSRDTLRCFAGQESRHPLTLVLRGRGFPTDAHLHVQLEEHSPLPLRAGEESGRDPVVMDCANVRASDVFPKQILYCTLTHPAVGLVKKPEWLERLKSQVMWMDLKLRRLPEKDGSNSEGQRAVVLGVLHHALQISLAPDASWAGTNADDTDAGEAIGDPFELLYQTGHSEAESDHAWLMLGIGGLKEQLKELYRRVFLSRAPSLRGVVGSLKLPHVRGVMLHGPPGSGKTLIARTITKLLGGGGAKVTIVNAADVLSKYVGESEKNLRHLLSGDEDDDENNTDNDAVEESDETERRAVRGRLHAIIIDEIESLFRRRGGSGDESSAKAVYDGLTNQLLTLMDGMDDAQNILVVGLTNQLHAIDRALLRPGRFEVVIEVPLPDLEGRAEVLLIHTQELRENNFLEPDIDLNALAAGTGGFSGADLAGTVRAAVSYAQMRYRDTRADDVGGKFQVTNDDLTLAIRDILRSKAQTAPGEYVGNGNEDSVAVPLVDYDGSVTQNTAATHRLLRSIDRSRATHAAVVVIYGPPGTGKTVLTQQLMRLWPFDVTKFLMGGELSGNPGVNRLEQILTALRDAVNIKENCGVVVENVEWYLRDGASAAADVLKAAIQEFRAAADVSSATYQHHSRAAVGRPPGKRLLILTTSDEEVFYGLMHSIEYDLQLTLHPIQRKNLVTLLRHYGILSSAKEASNDVVQAYPPKLSYRQFLRITDLALWRAHEAHIQHSKDGGVAESHQDSTVFSTLNALFLHGGRLHGLETGESSLDTEELQREFSAAVQDVVASMGLSDVFAGLLKVDDAIEGDEVSW